MSISEAQSSGTRLKEKGRAPSGSGSKEPAVSHGTLTGSQSKAAESSAGRQAPGDKSEAAKPTGSKKGKKGKQKGKTTGKKETKTTQQSASNELTSELSSQPTETPAESSKTESERVTDPAGVSPDEAKEASSAISQKTEQTQSSPVKQTLAEESGKDNLPQHNTQPSQEPTPDTQESTSCPPEKTLPGPDASLLKSPSSQSITRPPPDHTQSEEAVLEKLASAASEKKVGAQNHS